MLWPISPFILGHRLPVKPLVDNICEGLLPKSCVLLQQQYRAHHLFHPSLFSACSLTINMIRDERFCKATQSLLIHFFTFLLQEKMQQQGKKDLFVAYCNWSAGAKQDNRGLIKPIRKCSLQLQLQFLGDENKNLLCFLKLLSNTNIKHFWGRL